MSGECAPGDVLTELIAREPLFHRPEFGTTRADFDAMMDEDFREIGASGRYYSREYVLDVLEKRYRHEHEDRWRTRDFRCRVLGSDVYLLTYTLVQADRVTRRTTLWENRNGRWKALFHQGTLVRDAE